MRKLWSFLLIGALLLSGCTKAPAPDPEPQVVYDPAPQKAGEITVDGKALSGIYSDGAQEYLRADEVDWLSALPEGGLNTAEGRYLPKDVLLEGYHPFADEENNRTYYTAYPKAEEIPQGVKVPTLMYHAVSDDLWGIASLFVRPAELERQLQYLTEEGYTPIHFEDLGRVDEIQKPILLTFDDGYQDNYTELFPLLKKYNVKATVFMIMGSVGQEHYLTREQIAEMDQSGLVSFQSHTMTHEFLSTRTAEQLEEELYRSKLELARITGKESFVLCYPTGKYSESSLAATAEHYEFGLLMSGPTYVTGSDPLKITRKYISRSTDLNAFKNMIS
ncbi:MAG: polysaccharide deacetylase family protein [Clostridia bacterium]|nr:polysaccharide deacetylase family protein [Clostridia bacterium]